MLEIHQRLFEPLWVTLFLQAMAWMSAPQVGQMMFSSQNTDKQIEQTNPVSSGCLWQKHEVRKSTPLWFGSWRSARERWSDIDIVSKFCRQMRNASGLKYEPPVICAACCRKAESTLPRIQESMGMPERWAEHIAFIVGIYWLEVSLEPLMHRTRVSPAVAAVRCRHRFE